MLLLILVLASAAPVEAAQRSAKQLYQEACAACHGPDGRGMPRATVGFDIPLPDFTDCSFASREPAADWLAVSHRGGPARGFHALMPAFGEALTDDELRRTVDYVRSFCADPAWPRGELNLPRALVTEKAFPEDEVVLTMSVAARGSGFVSNEFLYERRFGPRNQVELAVPLDLREAAGGWSRGLGDAAVALKRALYHSLEQGTILSLAGEVIFPTGKENDGLGRGVTVFEPFVALGQILPHASFVQLQAGLELPADTARAGREAFWRVTLGRTWTEGRFGRSWSPMVELLGARELKQGTPVQWDVVPQVQVTLNRRKHIMLNAGARVPVNERTGRHPRVMVYLLWDWFDGGLFDGW